MNIASDLREFLSSTENYHFEPNVDNIFPEIFMQF